MISAKLFPPQIKFNLFCPFKWKNRKEKLIQNEHIPCTLPGQPHINLHHPNQVLLCRQNIPHNISQEILRFRWHSDLMCHSCRCGTHVFPTPGGVKFLTLLWHFIFSHLFLSLSFYCGIWNNFFFFFLQRVYVEIWGPLVFCFSLFSSLCMKGLFF